MMHSAWDLQRRDGPRRAAPDTEIDHEADEDTIDLRGPDWEHFRATASQDEQGLLQWSLDPPNPGLHALAAGRGAADDDLAGLPPGEIVRCANLLGWQVSEQLLTDGERVRLVFRRLVRP